MMDFTPESMASKLEKELLVGFVYNPGETLDVLVEMKPWDFADETNSEIYKTIVRLKNDSKHIDMENVASALQEEGLRQDEFDFLEDEAFEKSRDMKFKEAQVYVIEVQKNSMRKMTSSRRSKRDSFLQFTKSSFEQALLVGFVYNMERMKGVFLQAKSFDFYYGNHVVIFETLKEMMRDSDEIDLDMFLTKLGDESARNSRFKPADYAFLTSSSNAKNKEISLSRAQMYLQELRACSGVRTLSRRAEELRDVVYSSQNIRPVEAIALLDRAMHDVRKTASVEFQAFNWAGPILKEVIEDIRDKKSFFGEDFILTGFTDLDDRIVGLHPGLIVLAGRPQMGASEFAMNLAYNISKQKRVLYFTTTSTKQEFSFKSLSIFSGIPITDFYRGIFGKDLEKAAKAAEQISQHRLVVDYSPKLSLEKIVAMIKVFHSKEFDAVIIDNVSTVEQHLARKEEARGKQDYSSFASSNYFGYRMPQELVEDKLLFDTRFNKRDKRMNNIAYTLQVLGRELNIPIIAVTGCASEVDDRPLADPRLGDTIGPLFEKLADPVLLFHRPDYYEGIYTKSRTKSKPRKSEKINLFITRQTRGPAPTNIQLRYYQYYFLFEDLNSQGNA